MRARRHASHQAARERADPGTVEAFYFDGVRAQLGFVPNVASLMAIRPAVLTGWAGLQSALGGRLDHATREAIALVVSEVNGCAYCLATHSRAAAAFILTLIVLIRGRLQLASSSWP